MKEYKYKINGNIYKVGVGDIENNVAQVEVNGVPYNVEIEASKAPVTVVNAPRPAAAPRAALGEKVVTKTTSGVVAPLPGVVLSISAKVGDAVKASDTILLLEAMKMENAIHAGKDGNITAIHVAVGDSVLEGTPLFTIE